MLFTVSMSKKTVNGNFFTKVENKSINKVATPFGDVEQESKTTYYFFANAENEVGKEAEIDLSLFDVVEKDFPFTDKETGEEGIAKLKYLYPKRA